MASRASARRKPPIQSNYHQAVVENCEGYAASQNTENTVVGEGPSPRNPTILHGRSGRNHNG